MSIAGIRDAMKTGLQTINALRGVYDTVPDSINEYPAAFILPISGDYDLDAGGNWLPNFEVTLLIRRQGDVQDAQDTIDGFIAPSGSGSVKAAIEAADYGSHASSVRVARFKDYGGLLFAGVTYIGCKFDVEVLV